MQFLGTLSKFVERVMWHCCCQHRTVPQWTPSGFPSGKVSLSCASVKGTGGCSGRRLKTVDRNRYWKLLPLRVASLKPVLWELSLGGCHGLSIGSSAQGKAGYLSIQTRARTTDHGQYLLWLAGILGMVCYTAVVIRTVVEALFCLLGKISFSFDFSSTPRKLPSKRYFPFGRLTSVRIGCGPEQANHNTTSLC